MGGRGEGTRHPYDRIGSYRHAVCVVKLELMVLLSSRRSLLIRLIIVIVGLAGSGILRSAALEGAKLKESISKLKTIQHTCTQTHMKT